MEEKTSVDKDYKESFNLGHLISQELGLESNVLEGLSSEKYSIQAMRDGMKQYQKDLVEKSTEKDVIPPLDLDKFDNLANLDSKEPSKEKGKGFEPEI